MSNLNFLQAFVLNSNGNFRTNAKPPELVFPQIGLHEIDQFQITVGGSGATPSPTAKPKLFFAQNVGDSAYGAVRSKPIDIGKVRSYTGQVSRDAAIQITYLGYDEIDDNKDIYAVCGQQLVIPIHIYEKKLARWYNPVGFHRRLIVDTGCCPDCGSPCTAADKTYIAQNIANQINTGDQRVGDYVAGNELGQYLVATVVNNGGVGDALRVGVKITSKLSNDDAQQALNACDPVKYWEFQTYYFQIGAVYNGFCDGTRMPVTTTQMADPGTGWAAAVAALEAESQGFNRVRDYITAYPFSAKNGYVILAQAGTKYDYVHIVYDWTHRVGTGTTSHITEPYEVVIPVAHGQSTALLAALNAWTTGKFPAIVFA